MTQSGQFIICIEIHTYDSRIKKCGQGLPQSLPTLSNGTSLKTCGQAVYSQIHQIPAVTWEAMYLQ